MEKYIESEKVFTDRFNSEDTDSDNQNVTRNDISHRVKQNVYSRQVSNLFKHY